MNRLVVLGDSHSHAAAASGAFEQVFVDGLTLNRFGRSQEALSLIGSAEAGAVFFITLGEIDVRCHVGHQIEKQRSLDEVVSGLSQGALSAIHEVETKWPVRVAFSEVIPPIEHQRHETWPWYGSIAERVLWTQALNDRLRSDLPLVFDPYPAYTLPDGTLDPDCADGSVHLRTELGAEAFGPIAQKLSKLS